MDFELKKNQTAVCDMEGMTHEGMGVARVDGRVVFVRGAAPGERCAVKLIKCAQNAAFAVIEEILSPSPSRVTPDCPVYPVCGGCVFRHMTYEAELEAKVAHVEQTLRRIGGVDLRAEDVFAAPALDAYRNKTAYPVGRDAAGCAVTGFYRARSHDIVPTVRCRLQHPDADAAAAVLRHWLDRNPAVPVRHILTRAGSGGVLVCVVASADPPESAAELVGELRRALPGLAGVVWDRHGGEGNVILGEEPAALWGDGFVEDRLCGLRFRISAHSFYQVNRLQAERLYDRAVEYAGDFAHAVDLYCGIGTLTLRLAAGGGRVTGVEIVEQAVEDARENARINGIEAEFLCADAARAAGGLRPDVVLVDPPRKGLSVEALEAVAGMAPRRVVYVSCDPATLARDLRLFSAHGYRAGRLTVVDLFPRCAHVECVVLLTR